MANIRECHSGLSGKFETRRTYSGNLVTKLWWRLPARECFRSVSRRVSVRNYGDFWVLDVTICA